MDAETAAPRARAAWAFSGLNQRELAQAAGLTYDRVRAILGTAKRAEVSLDELHAIADATGVPDEFMEYGWPATRDERIAKLEATQHRLEARLLVLEEEAKQRSAGRGRTSEGPPQ